MDAVEKVLNLPNIVENIVANIFPRRQRREIMLVSKVFRDAFYKLQEPTCNMRIDEETLNDNLIIESMINSKRRIHHAEIEIKFNELNLHTVADIFQKRGDQIQTLKGTFTNEQMTNARVFLKLMKNFPNVNKLELSFSDIHIVNWMNCEHILGLNGMIDLELAALKCNLGREFAQIFVPNSIEELEIKCQLDLFEDLMKSQSSITKLATTTKLLKPELLKALNLEYFEITSHNPTAVIQESSNALLEQLERDHPELKELKFKFPMSPALLTALCKKSNLESLQLYVDNRNIHHFQQLANLPKSTPVYLNLRRYSELEIIQLTLTPLHNIESIEIDFKEKEFDEPILGIPISEAFFENIGRNWPNIKKFALSGKRVLINNVLEHLENLQMLNIDLTGSDFCFHYNSSTYPHMTCLIIDQVEHVFNLPELLKKMPNLKTLSFNWIFYRQNTFYSDSLLDLLAKMENLEVLYIDFKIMSAKAIASENEIKMLKKLCSKLKMFLISFHQKSANFPFNNHLNKELKDCSMEVFFVHGELILVLFKRFRLHAGIKTLKKHC